MTFLTNLGVTEILCSFRFVLNGKPGKEMPKSSRSEFLEKFLANIFALSEAEDNTSKLMNTGGIAGLPLLRTLLTIHQKSQDPSLWDMIDSFFIVTFFSICKFGSFKNPFATITSLSELQKIYHVGKNKKSDFYEIWQQQK